MGIFQLLFLVGPSRGSSRGRTAKGAVVWLVDAPIALAEEQTDSLDAHPIGRPGPPYRFYQTSSAEHPWDDDMGTWIRTPFVGSPASDQELASQSQMPQGFV